MDEDNYDEDVVMTTEVKEQQSTSKINIEIKSQPAGGPAVVNPPLLMQQQELHKRVMQNQRMTGVQPSTVSFTSSQPSLSPQNPQFPSSVPLAVQHAIHDRAKMVELEEDKAFVELLQELESFEPIIPDQLTDYYMTRAGLDAADVRVKRLISLIAQKYVTDIAQDAVQYCKIRTNATGTSGPSSMSKETSSSAKKPVASSKEKKLVLSMDDLSASLADYGIALKKPAAYR
jgi:transcription initiation factor TFIID subunit 10